jgi:flavin-dependent dehydrogenase
MKFELTSDSRVAVIGGGPAGSFFSYFLLDIADRVGPDLTVDIYEPRDFSAVGPIACNMCGGIISETLVQNLATDGINLPPTVIQRGIDSYILHTERGSARIETPRHEMRIGSVYRASGPRDMKDSKWMSFDGFLQERAMEKGARVTRERVEEILWKNGRPQIKTKCGEPDAYDLLVVAVGINSPTLKLFEDMIDGYVPPQTSKTFMREYLFGEETLAKSLGSSMHVFLLNIPGLEFAAIIPKGDYASVCLLGDKIDKDLLQKFLGSPEVKRCMPPDWDSSSNSCQCSPKISIRGASRPFGDRIVFIGDSAVTRLYKDGIGAAYRTAKAAAVTAIYQGISAADFENYYGPICRTLENDNGIGKFVFAVTQQIQKRRYARSAVHRMVTNEQKTKARTPRMSMVMWDLFTGSATYREVLKRTLHPVFLVRFLRDIMGSIVRGE